MITLISTPECNYDVSPVITSRWVATECPNVFQFIRRDYTVSVTANEGGNLRVTLNESYTGSDGNSVSLYDATTDSMYTGIVTDSSGSPVIDTDITFVTGMDITYMNDHTEFAGHYVEVRLTINGVAEPLTVKASPNSYGLADVDVSPVLRTKTRPVKTGDYSDRIMIEPTKSGRFSVEYRERYYGSDTAWTPEGGSISPPSDEIVWHYVESVRSVEQGSNLSEYVPSDLNDAPFFNLFSQPVYNLGLPFDISFLMPDMEDVSPESEVTVTITVYSSMNVQIGAAIVETIPTADLEGYVCSLNISEDTIPENAAYLTAEITVA